MANTLSTKTFREKYLKSQLDYTLRNALVAEKVCAVDRSDVKTIQSPYGSASTVAVQALAGTYTPATFTTTDDTLTVTDEFVVSEHIFGFESILSQFDLYASRMDQLMYDVAAKVDNYVINNLCEDGTGTYTTPAGGFTTAANINEIMANLISKVAGYADSYANGLFLIIENTDLVGFAQAGATNGFTLADATLKNGFMNNWMGVDVYVVRAGTFTDATVGTKTWTNSGHRVFGVKNMATFASPRGVQYEEKAVSGKTGTEVVVYGLVGFKLWTPKAGLVVDITLA